MELSFHGGAEMQISRRNAITLFGAAALGAASGLTPLRSSLVAAKASGSDDREKVDILMAGASFYDVPYYAMRDFGFAEQHNIEVEATQNFDGGSSAAQIFAGGFGDVLISGMNGVVAIGREGLIDLTVLGVWTKYPYHRVVGKKDSEYTALEDLRGSGAVIGVSGSGSFGDLLIRDALVTLGIDPDAEVEIVNAGGAAAQVAALDSGSIDLSLLLPPVYVIEADNLQTVHRFNQVEVPSSVFTARTGDVEDNPEKFANFMGAYADAASAMIDDPAFALEVADASWGDGIDDAEVLKACVDEFLGIWSADGLFTEAQYDNSIAMLINSGLFEAEGMPSFEEMTAAAPEF